MNMTHLLSQVIEVKGLMHRMHSKMNEGENIKFKKDIHKERKINSKRSIDIGYGINSNSRLVRTDFLFVAVKQKSMILLVMILEISDFKTWKGL